MENILLSFHETNQVYTMKTKLYSPDSEPESQSASQLRHQGVDGEGWVIRLGDGDCLVYGQGHIRFIKTFQLFVCCQGSKNLKGSIFNFQDIAIMLLNPCFNARLWTKGFSTSICKIQNVKEGFHTLPFLIYKLSE